MRPKKDVGGFSRFNDGLPLLDSFCAQGRYLTLALSELMEYWRFMRGRVERGSSLRRPPARTQSQIKIAVVLRT